MMKRQDVRSAVGFSLIELMVSMGIMSIVAGVGISALRQLTQSQQIIWNRTEMHSGVRSATELLQQEVGQAGRVAPMTTDAVAYPVKLNAAVGVGTNTVTLATTCPCSPTGNLYIGEKLTIGVGINQEVVAITGLNNAAHQVTAAFTLPHVLGNPVTVAGGFADGIVPPGAANGSTASKLKIYGDLNSDGSMVYVEYTCDGAAGTSTLYRNMMAWTAAAKPAITTSMALLPSVQNSNCFTYQTASDGVGNTYVTDVAITLTVQTQQVDPVTKQFQQETKALLNVSPRNIFDIWELSSAGWAAQRVQPMPASVALLLP